MSNKSIKVIVRNTEDVLFDGPVDRISSFNEVGRFDVFPMHANFISIIQKELALYNDHKLVKEMKLEKAIMKVKQDEVNIFLGIESLAIDEKTLEGAIEPPTAPEKK
jgi:F0F1-type ATP synthase epsilon subunit